MPVTISRRRRCCTVRRIVLAILTFFATSPLLVIFLLREPGESFGLEKSLRNFRSISNSDHKIPESNVKAQPDLNGLSNSAKNNKINRLHQPANKQAQQAIVHKDIELPVLKEGVIGNYEPSMPRKGPDGPGEGGKKVGRIPEEEEKYAQSYKEYGFNMVNSDKISLDRTVPDLRDPECKFWHYPSKLPLSSVVIVFHNEGWSTLMRTVHSVINETPPELLLEIVMVDDFSDKEHLQKKLEDYIKKPFLQNKVRLIRNVKREGLIRSRIIGAEHARAQVLIFLDAHCECNPNWLPPLVAEIAVNRTTVVCPTVDSVDADTYEYHPQGDGLCRGIFNWDFWYKRVPVDESRERLGLKYRSEAYASPVMAGGLFGLDRSYFFEIGAYDPGLEIWGGENMEISFKAWMCGGRLKFVPCSRVGHIYRHGVPYSYPDSGVKGVSVVHLNYMRVAEVWMDEYKEYFYTMRPELRGKPFGDISEQVAFRKKNCPNSFKWFMEEVAPDSLKHWPPPLPNQGYGEIRATSSDLCVDTLGHRNGGIGMYYCHGMGGNQRFRLSGDGILFCHESCMYPEHDKVNIVDCKNLVSKAKWSYDEDKEQIAIPTRNMCLDHNSATKELVLAECNTLKDSQHFKFIPPTD